MASLVNSFVLLALCAIVASAQEKVQVAVYFESYCPDSVKFLTKQLYPAFLGPLGDYMNLTLVPYGKAKTNRSETGVTFTCDNGDKECLGNKVIACVLEEKNVSFADQFKFINCTSSTIATNFKQENYPVRNCVTGISSLTVEKIDGCAKQAEGNRLLDMFGNKTETAFPNSLTNVPTVVFNDKFNAADQTAAVSDFRMALCSKITSSKPAECTTKSSASGLQAAVLPLIAAVYVVSRL